MKKKFYYPVEVPKIQLIIWIAAQVGVFIWGSVEFLHGKTSAFIQMIWILIFSHLWDCFQFFGHGRSFIAKIDVKSQTILTIFMFVALVLGSTFNLNHEFKYFDECLHCFSGVLATWVGYDWCVIMQGEKKPVQPALASMFALAFSMTIAIGWEFYEFSVDRLYGFAVQCSTPYVENGLIDTMTDLIACATGSVVTMLLTAFYKNGIIGKHRKEIKAKRLEEKKKWEQFTSIDDAIKK
ncbi:MAG: hypothetical protein K5917_01870 [Clostridiales bacterium]|nr:hypothetical protein [Clostridiales bacterium]